MFNCYKSNEPKRCSPHSYCPFMTNVIASTQIKTVHVLISMISVLLHFWVFSAADCTILTQRKRLDFFDVITRFIVINKPHMNDWLCALTTEPQKTSTKRKSFTLVIWHIGNKSQDGQPAKNSTKRRLTTSKKGEKECRGKWY